MSAQDRGLAFEKEVERLFRRLGHFRVKRNVTLRDSHGNLSQIDLVYGLWRRVYVECKNYSGPVPLKDVAKFSSVLELNGIPLSRGLFVTNSTYVPRATTIGIKCIDGKQLAAMKRKARLRGWSQILVVGGVVGAIVATQYMP